MVPRVCTAISTGLISARFDTKNLSVFWNQTKFISKQEISVPRARRDRSTHVCGMYWDHCAGHVSPVSGTPARLAHSHSVTAASRQAFGAGRGRGRALARTSAQDSAVGGRRAGIKTPGPSVRQRFETGVTLQRESPFVALTASPPRVWGKTWLAQAHCVIFTESQIPRFGSPARGLRSVHHKLQPCCQRSAHCTQKRLLQTERVALHQELGRFC